MSRKKTTSATDMHKAVVEELHRINGGVEWAFKRVAKMADDEAVAQTSGMSPSGKSRIAQLRKLRYPFGRRMQAVRPGRGQVRGGLKSLPIHVVSGRLRKSHKFVTRRPGARFSLRLQSRWTAPHAKFILGLGTTKMVDRGFEKAHNMHWRRLMNAFRRYARSAAKGI